MVPTDNAIITDQLSRMPSNIAAAVLPLGLPQSSLGQFIGLLVGHDNAGLSQVEGVTVEIIQAGAGALLKTYSLGFRYVWIAAGSITVVAAVGKSRTQNIAMCGVPPLIKGFRCLLPPRIGGRI